MKVTSLGSRMLFADSVPWGIGHGLCRDIGPVRCYCNTQRKVLPGVHGASRHDRQNHLDIPCGRRSDKMLPAEITNWTGNIIVAPRVQIAALTQRTEVKCTGIYCLVGPDPESPHRDRVYVGEGGNLTSIGRHEPNLGLLSDIFARSCNGMRRF